MRPAAFTVVGQLLEERLVLSSLAITAHALADTDTEADVAVGVGSTAHVTTFAFKGLPDGTVGGYDDVDRNGADGNSTTSACVIQIAGDFDRDGDIDAGDRTILTQHWTGALRPGEGNLTFEQGDADEDGDVDSADLNLLTQNWTGAHTTVDLNVSDLVGGLNTTHQQEMQIAFNPANPDMLAAFTRSIGGGQEALDLLLSYDSGISWSRTRVDEAVDGHATTDRADPVLAFDEHGILFIAYIVGPNIDRGLVLGRIVDDISTIETIDIVDGCCSPTPDKPTIATGVDPSTGNQAVYVAWHHASTSEITRNVGVWGSNDASDAFPFSSLTSVYVPNMVDNVPSIQEFAEVEVGSDGEVYVAWHDRGFMDDDPLNDRLLFDVDTDGLFAGIGFGSDVAIDLNFGLFKTSVPAQPSRGIFNGPVLAVDRSAGPDGEVNNDPIYLTFVDLPPGASHPDYDVYASKGTFSNGDWSWTQPNDFESPTGGRGNIASTSHTEFLPNIDVDPVTGKVHVFYYESSGPDEEQANAILAISADGETFDYDCNPEDGRNHCVVSDSPTDESAGSGEDYLEYIGLDVYDDESFVIWASNSDPEADILDAYFQMVTADFGVSCGNSKAGSSTAAYDEVFKYSGDKGVRNGSSLERTLSAGTAFTGSIDDLHSCIDEDIDFLNDIEETLSVLVR